MIVAQPVRRPASVHALAILPKRWSRLASPTIPGTLRVPNACAFVSAPSMIAEICTRGFWPYVQGANALGHTFYGPRWTSDRCSSYSRQSNLADRWVASVWKITPARQSFPISATAAPRRFRYWRHDRDQDVLSSITRFSSSRSIRPSFCTGCR